MRSFGYRSSALAALVLAENGFLLLSGLALGAGSALISVAPHLLDGSSAMPWGSLSVTLLAVAIVGMASGALAVASALRDPLIPALRSG